jgi:hypothetical protein
LKRFCKVGQNPENNEEKYKLKFKRFKDCTWERIESFKGRGKEIINTFKEFQEREKLQNHDSFFVL